MPAPAPAPQVVQPSSPATASNNQIVLPKAPSTDVPHPSTAQAMPAPAPAPAPQVARQLPPPANPVVTPQAMPHNTIANIKKDANGIHNTNKQTAVIHANTTRPSISGGKVDQEREKLVTEELLDLTLYDDNAQVLAEMSFKQYSKLFNIDHGVYAISARDRMEDIQMFIENRHHYLVDVDTTVDAENMKYALLDSVINGNVSDARTILDNYALLQSRDKYGNNLLSIAAIQNDADMAVFLLARGVDMYAVNYNMEDPMYISQYLNNDAVGSVLNAAVFLPK